MKIIKWLENYWYYYKFQTFAALFIIAVTAVIITQCSTSVQPDLYVYYLTQDPVVYSEDMTNLSNAVRYYTEDVNNDGQINVQVVNYFVGEEYEQNWRSDFVTAYQAGGIMLILADQYSMDYLVETGFIGNNVSGLTDDLSYDGCAWQINGSEFSNRQEMKYLTEDLYFTLRVFNEKSWIQAIPGKTDEYNSAEAVLGRIIREEPEN